jgi:hypothetical protein
MQITPDLVAAGNIGGIAQIASGTSIPVLHMIELLDFAHGGPTPDGCVAFPFPLSAGNARNLGCMGAYMSRI